MVPGDVHNSMPGTAHWQNRNEFLLL